ncbi:hypothetical protein Hypma_012971 [Hypsizygus marmoreus]|uniref:Uncharacterized protein n=1 Tax=Hypsizygus marmoreus TaxID=39966 RepID=A0A369JHU3_HYPMA|nr:hypothetical protein Hypma_012971 [Hypsizygus marmoreus]
MSHSFSSSSSFLTHPPHSSPDTSSQLVQDPRLKPHTVLLPSGTEQIIIPKSSHQYLIQIHPHLAALFRIHLPRAAYTISTSLDTAHYLAANSVVEQINITIFKSCRNKLPKALSTRLMATARPFTCSIEVHDVTDVELERLLGQMGASAYVPAPDDGHEQRGDEGSSRDGGEGSDRDGGGKGHGGGGGPGGGVGGLGTGMTPYELNPSITSRLTPDLLGSWTQKFTLHQTTKVNISPPGHVGVTVKSFRIGTSANMGGHYELTTIKFAMFPCSAGGVGTDNVYPSQQPSFETIHQAGQKPTTSGHVVILTDEDEQGQGWTYHITNPHYREFGLTLMNPDGEAPSLRFRYMRQPPSYIVIKFICVWQVRTSATNPLQPSPGYENIIHQVELKLPLDSTAREFRAKGEVQLELKPPTPPDGSIHDSECEVEVKVEGQSNPRCLIKTQTGICATVPELWLGQPSGPKHQTIIEKLRAWAKQKLQQIFLVRH